MKRKQLHVPERTRRCAVTSLLRLLCTSQKALSLDQPRSSKTGIAREMCWCAECLNGIDQETMVDVRALGFSLFYLGIEEEVYPVSDIQAVSKVTLGSSACSKV